MRALSEWGDNNFSEEEEEGVSRDGKPTPLNFMFPCQWVLHKVKEIQQFVGEWSVTV